MEPEASRVPQLLSRFPQIEMKDIVRGDSSNSSCRSIIRVAQKFDIHAFRDRVAEGEIAP
jgi:hypothetical protein